MDSNSPTMKYDVFISYRRDGGAQYARILQLMLQQRGYKVFLDYDELTDGVFGENIKRAIEEISVFMLILSKGALLRCVNEGDWMRQEIMLAVQYGKKIIPVNPDGMFEGLSSEPGKPNIPEEIQRVVREYQHSEIRFGQTLGVDIDLMVKNRIVPMLGEATQTSHIDQTEDAELRVTHNNKVVTKRTNVILVAVLVLTLLGVALFWPRFASNDAERQRGLTDVAAMRADMHNKYSSLLLYLDPEVTELQLNSLDKLLHNMSEVRKGELWMSQFEFSKELWYGLQNIPYKAEDGNLPMTGLSYGEIYLFLGKLNDMTNLDIALPSVEEWMYAARGGEYNETTLYVGDDDANEVAWYGANSGGVVHPSDGRQGKSSNMLDLYDMSGNVSELCNSTYGEDHTQYIICGGNFNSPITEITANSQAPFGVNDKDSTVGFRVIIRVGHLN